MKYNLLGNTGVLVSEIGLGAMTFGGGGQWGVFGGLGEQDAARLVGQALDAGVNFFDTSNIYAGGRSEEILGKALGTKRQDVIIATKVRGRTGSGPNDLGLSRLHIIRQVDESLKRLGTDYIDLYQIHNPDQLTDWEETLRALDDLIRSGKVRYIGSSNMTGWELMKARGISRELGLHAFKSSQSYYSLAGRDIEREIIPVLKDQNMGLLVWSPLAGGFLSGKYTRTRTGNTDDRHTKFAFPPVDVDKAYSIIDVLEDIAKKRESTVARIALAWVLNQPAVTSVIVGAKRPDQLQDNLEASGIVLTDDELARLDEASRLPIEYPAWPFMEEDDSIIRKHP
ncbi:aryl-alcohol dehydrogenase-like predicted oxidoreductase [Paenibacillus rhizosphaerae]|uniref:Aryl-alcohol dehydrogenase-like predicted oxidoreductase n=1 Tax=Paenibacillus rhizosphaerae TaxID=297318 RepID=A0A839TQL8_9BACL|nr:aldo/keto reductase [Paenibacillus rhizosphaerae]MBB3129012.1 aryl-alcohol dehydrogenase-like predicted oxidoreductase [Paenibacillus rhizosphaerae]